MIEIEFSVMVAELADADHLLPILEAFEKQYHIRVKLTGITWVKGWTEIAKFGIYGHGPDVSCVGTSWLGSLASMQVLRPFTPQEVRSLGGAEAFFEPSWQTGFLPNDQTAWAIPWLGDPMVFYYWKDVLEKAGIQDFDAAFATDEALIETLKKLQKSGFAHPLALTTGYNNTVNLHEAAHWLWNAGGNFISPDYKQVAFNQPAAMQGLRNYFSLQPFISPKASTMRYPGDLFNAGESPIHLGGLWHGMTGRKRNPEWDKRLGVAQLPGTSYVGGGSFVIWKYSLYYREAFELLRFLSSQPTRIPASPHAPVDMPTRRDAFNIPSVQNDIFHRTYVQAMQNRRSFPSIRLWGSIESKLVAEIPNIWAELFANPDQDLDECLHRHLDPLVQRMNNTLEN